MDEKFKLNQRQAAELIGRTPRFLRDHQECPRGAGGDYDARQVVEWFVGYECEESSDLKAEKIREEIHVLKERNRKLQFENETTAGNLANVNNLRDMLYGLVPPFQRLGELVGRKSNLTGPDVQQMINKTLDDYERLLAEGLPNDGNHIAAHG